MWMWLFIVSFVFNVFIMAYVRWLLTTVSVMNQDMESLNNMIQRFTVHLKSIYEMEMFYGDDTLKSLMNHANELTNRLTEIDLILNDEEAVIEEAQKKD